jgi:uncharacterized protein
MGAALPLWICVLIPLAAHAQDDKGPSFRCRGAAIEAEQAICSDRQLSRLDRRVAKAWNSYLDNFDDLRILAAIRADLAGWLAQRDACKSDGGCIGNAYAARYELLMGKQPRRQFAGVYESAVGRMAVYPASDGTYLVGIMTSDAVRGAWVCVVAGPGSISANLLTVKIGVDSLVVSREGGAMRIESNPSTAAVEQKYCGIHGTIASTYRPLDP